MTSEYRLHGPPGCGKTYALANKWVPAAVTKFGEGAVMVASLTKTAATEIASRLPLPKDRIGTLHSHAYRSLGSPEIYEKHLGDWNDRNPHWRVAGGVDHDEGNLQMALSGKPSGTVLLEMLSIERQRMTPKTAWRQDVRLFEKAWTDWKASLDVVDFDDMISHALESVPVAPNSPEVILVDEAQDCSHLELALVRKWAQHADHLVLAGDGDQAIFDWRGADADAFLGGDVPEDHNYTLSQSYRVPKAVHALAVQWIARASRRYAVEYAPREYMGAVKRSSASGRYPQMMIPELQRDLDTGDTVMLVASCSYMLKKVIAGLRAHGVPFHNPYRTKTGAWNPMRGGVERLGAFLAPSPHFAAEGEAPHLWTVREMKRWVDVVRADILPRGTKKRLDEACKAGTSRNTVGAMTPAYASELLGPDLFNRLRQIHLESGDDPLRAVKWMQANILNSKQRLMQFSFDIARSKGLQGLREKPRLIIGTIHSVKGGEADHVHILPDIPRNAFEGWMTPGPSRDSVLRQFYVAATRAKKTLTIHTRSEPYSVDL